MSRPDLDLLDHFAGQAQGKAPGPWERSPETPDHAAACSAWVGVDAALVADLARLLAPAPEQPGGGTP